MTLSPKYVFLTKKYASFLFFIYFLPNNYRGGDKLAPLVYSPLRPFASCVGFRRFTHSHQVVAPRLEWPIGWRYAYGITGVSELHRLSLFTQLRVYSRLHSRLLYVFQRTNYFLVGRSCSWMTFTNPFSLIC